LDIQAIILRAVLQPPQSLCRRAGISLHSSTNSKFRKYKLRQQLNPFAADFRFERTESQLCCRLTKFIEVLPKSDGTSLTFRIALGD
jgi:hypothetical protein